MKKGQEDTEEEQECVCTPVQKKEDKRKGLGSVTCPWDPRFQNVNQTKYCYFSFVDWHRCTRLLGDNYKGCMLFHVCWETMCPNSWKEKWFDQMNNGTFPRPIYPPKEGPYERPKNLSQYDV